jgi:hypothetical protein
MSRLTEIQIEWSEVAYDRELRRPRFRVVILRKGKHGCVAGNG